MDETDLTSHPAGSGRAGGATIHPLRLPAKTAARPSASDDAIALEEVGEVVAQAMGSLLRVQLGGPGHRQGAARSFASRFELSQIIDTFLAIRDTERRRYCLAVLRSCAMADAEERGSAG